jgi:hypothetical protein
MAPDRAPPAGEPTAEFPPVDAELIASFRRRRRRWFEVLATGAVLLVASGYLSHVAAHQEGMSALLYALATLVGVVGAVLMVFGHWISRYVCPRCGALPRRVSTGGVVVDYLAFPERCSECGVAFKMPGC